MIIIDRTLDISSKYYKKILEILNIPSAKSRLIGGCVRDAILGRANLDIDIATTLLPNQVMQILAKKNIKTLPTGIKFGTISAFLKDEKFEITTLRRDIDCRGRYAIVAFTNDFKIDAARRDFTINALSYCPFQNQIYDYFSGLEDLEKSTLQFIGEARARIKEDYLRILRFFRFSSKYALDIDQMGYEACVELQQGLNLLSRERIKWEMDKIIASDNCGFILNKMFESSILTTLFKIESFDPTIFYHALDLAKKPHVTFSLSARYALLFYNLQNFNYKELLALKFSKVNTGQILDIIETIKRPKDFITHITLTKIWLEQKENYIDFILTLAATDKIDDRSAVEFITNHISRIRPIFPINGNDLYNLGYRLKEIKDQLNFLKEKWIESDFHLTKTQLLQLTKK